MYKLVIWAKYSQSSKMADRKVPGAFEYESSSHAELRALRWLIYCPEDIVMLVGPGDVKEAVR